MIKLDEIREALAACEEDDELLPVTRSWLERALLEIEQGRAAAAELARVGSTFGLGADTRL